MKFMNKKGDFTGVLFFIVSIAAFAIFLLVIGYIAPEISGAVQNQIGISAEINNSLGTTTAIAQNTLPTIWMMMFGGLLLGLFITAFFVPTHPIFAPIFGILLIITVMVSVPLSNAYMALTENSILAGAAANQGLIVFIMEFLPFISFAIGIIVLIVAFAKPGSGNEVPI